MSLKKCLVGLLVLSSYQFIYTTIPTQVLICGVCKNIESKIPCTINIVESIGSMFDDYRVIIYENNSTDSTIKKLIQWSQQNARVSIFTEVVSEALLAKEIVNFCTYFKELFRPERISRARNIALNKAMSAEYEDYPYIIWLDLDFRIMPNFEGIKEVFYSTEEWDAVFANGVVVGTEETYDWYALRDKNYPLGPEVIGNDWWQKKHLTLSKNSNWYPVYSAFGGCGVYKRSSLQGCHYSALITPDLETLVSRILSDERLRNNQFVKKYWHERKTFHTIRYYEKPIVQGPAITDPWVGIAIRTARDAIIWRMNTHTFQYPSVCEHVTLHASMIAHGHDKLYINPRMLFTYAW